MSDNREARPLSAAADFLEVALRADLAAAIEHHRLCLEQFGEDDPRSIEAALRCMLLLPEQAFRELQEIANAVMH